MDQPESEHASQLFTLRVWLEEVAPEHLEWRGQLLHVNSGEVRYFRDWQTLLVRLLAMLPDVTPTPHAE